MPAIRFDIDTRIQTLLLVEMADEEKQRVIEAFRAAGDWHLFQTAVADLAPDLLSSLDWANTLGDWSMVISKGTGVGKDDVALVRSMLADAAVNSLRDLALKYGLEQLLARLKELFP